MPKASDLRKKRLDTKLSKPLHIALSIGILASGAFLSWMESGRISEKMRSDMLIQARMIVASLNVDSIRRLKGDESDLESGDYRELREILIRIRSANPTYRYLYLMGQQVDGKRFFYMGTAPEGGEDYSPPGQEYFEDSPSLRAAFSQARESLSPPFTDRWGTWRSALIPIPSALVSEKPLAVFGMDYDASSWNSVLIRQASAPLILSILALLAFIAMAEFVRQGLIAQRLKLLEESEAFRKRVFEHSPVAMVVMDPVTMRYIECNPAAAMLYRYSAADKVVGKTPLDFSPGFQEGGKDSAALAREHIDRALREGRTSFIWHHLRPGGEPWIAEVELHSFESEGKILLQFAFVDVSAKRKAEEERERLQAQLFQAQKLESIGLLAGGLAHDFNNILQTILANTELALEETSPDSSLQGLLKDSKRATLRSAELTRQLLAFARKQTIAPVEIELDKEISDNLNILKRLLGENIDITWEPGGLGRVVTMDPVQIEQILTNLLINARDAIHGRGRIKISTETVNLSEKSADHPEELELGNYLALRVTDDGEGIDQALLPRIFEPFFTTKNQTTKNKRQGTGLGLSTVYGIVKQNGGAIRVESRLEEGSCFSVYLPASTATEKRLGFTSEARVIASAGGKVLLVEDDPMIVKSLQSLLRGLGFDVLTAHTPAQALAYTTLELEGLNLLISDIVMPGMNGRDLAQALLERRPQLRCLFISGYAADHIEREGVLEEGLHFLQKPFGLEELSAMLEKVLSAPPGIGRPREGSDSRTA